MGVHGAGSSLLRWHARVGATLFVRCASRVSVDTSQPHLTTCLSHSLPQARLGETFSFHVYVTNVTVRQPPHGTLSREQLPFCCDVTSFEGLGEASRCVPWIS